MWIGLTWLRIKIGILNEWDEGRGETYLVESNICILHKWNSRVWIGLTWLGIVIGI